MVVWSPERICSDVGVMTSYDIQGCGWIMLNIQELESTKNQLSCSLLFLGSYICCSQNVAPLSGFAKQVVQEFSRYNNTLLLTVANELATWSNSGRFSVTFFSFGGSPFPAICHWRERCESTCTPQCHAWTCLNMPEHAWTAIQNGQEERLSAVAAVRSVTLLAIANEAMGLCSLDPMLEAQNDKNGWAAFPCVKALTRDVHRYQACRVSPVPVFYAAKRRQCHKVTLERVSMK